jgi:hypothetical protein
MGNKVECECYYDINEDKFSLLLCSDDQMIELNFELNFYSIITLCPKKVTKKSKLTTFQGLVIQVYPTFLRFDRRFYTTRHHPK